MTAQRPRPYSVTSHENISHQDIDNLAYDWTRAADPDVAPRRPLTVYFPASVGDVVEIYNRHADPTRTLRIRARGHSSNDLVLGGRDTSIVVTEYMRWIDPPDESAGTVRVGCGAVMAEIDAALASRGWGLPVIGDHNHITAGGFASVGGVSPASHHAGMFIDNVVRLEFVTPEGTESECTPADPIFYRLLGGMGRFGFITSLVLRIIPVDKHRTILENRRRVTLDLQRFLDWSEGMVLDSEGARMERGMWADLPTPFGSFQVGQVSSYFETDWRRRKVLWNRITHAVLHGIGRVAGRLPHLLDRIVQYLGMVGIVLSPRYASIANIESFADRTIDSSVGDPTRMLIVFPPADQYRAVTTKLEEICRRYRTSAGCITFICMYVKGIVSPYLAHASGHPDRKFSEIVLYLGVAPGPMRVYLDRLVEEIDALCVEHGAFRYMHTRTVPLDSPLRARIDPNEAHAAASARGGVTRTTAS